MEDLRWYCIREIGKIQETARASGKNAHVLRMEFDVLKGRADTQSDAHLVEAEFTKQRADTEVEFAKVRADTREEMVNVLAEIDLEGVEAKFDTLKDQMDDFAKNVEITFNKVEAVESSFQAHAGQAFNETVTGLKWLHENTEARFTNIDADLNVTLKTLIGSPAPVRQVPSGSAASAPGLAGCAAGPFACGSCGPRTAGGAATYAEYGYGERAAAFGQHTGDTPGDAPGDGGDGGFHGHLLAGITAGNGECHCVHVSKLQEEMLDVQA
jgi:hypothetical protein